MSDSQDWNAVESMLVRAVEEKSADVSAVDWKAPYLISTKLEGKLTDVSDVHR